ncbi:hypothetical protein NMC42_11595 [Pseudomonas aeruginosa]
MLAFLLRFDHRLVFRLVQGMDLGGAVGAFHFDMLKAQTGGFRRARGMLLPPEVAEADQQGEQQQADYTQHVARQAHRLDDPSQALYGAAAGIGAGEMVEAVDQLGLVEAHELGVGADVTAREGVSRQLVERAVFQLTQRILGQVQLPGHLRQRQALLLARLAQGFPGVLTGSGGYDFGLRRFHHFSAWNS